MTEFDWPEGTLCGWQGAEIQFLICFALKTVTGMVVTDSDSNDDCCLSAFPWGSCSNEQEGCMHNCFPTPVCTALQKVHCYPLLQQLLPNFRDFRDGVCHVMVITAAEGNPDAELLTQAFCFSPNSLARDSKMPVMTVLLLLKRCFTSTETVGLLGTGAQDGHLDFHTASELWVIVAIVDCFYMHYSPLLSRLTALLLHVILNEWLLLFTECSWIVVCLQHSFGCCVIGATWNCCHLGSK